MAISMAGALVGSALLGAGTSIIGGSKASNAAQQSAQVQADAARYAADKQFEQYNITRGDLAPFRNVGVNALNNLSNFGGFNPTPWSAPNTGGTKSNLQNLTPMGNWSGQPASPQMAGPVQQNFGSPAAPTTGAYTPVAGGATPTTGATASSPGGLPSAAPLGTSPAAQTLILPDGTEVQMPQGAAQPGQQVTIPDSIGGPPAQTFTIPANAQPAPLPSGTTQPAPETLPNDLAATQAPPGPTGALGVSAPDLTPRDGSQNFQSNFLTDLQNLAPGADGANANPLLTSLRSLVPGSSDPSAFLTAMNRYADGTDPVLTRLNNLLGVGGPGGAFDAESVQRALEATPGYKFTLDQGLKSTQNSFAAKGLGNSGAALKGAAQFTTGLADQTYQSQLNNYLTSYNAQFANTRNAYGQQFDNAYNAYGQGFNNAYNAYGQQYTNALNLDNQLYNQGFNLNQQRYNQELGGYTTNFNNALNLVTLGQNAAVQTGTLGQQAASNAGGYLTSGAAAQAAGIVGSSNALVSGLTGVANSISQGAIGSALAGGAGTGIYGSSYAAGAANPFAIGM